MLLTGRRPNPATHPPEHDIPVHRGSFTAETLNVLSMRSILALVHQQVRKGRLVRLERPGCSPSICMPTPSCIVYCLVAGGSSNALTRSLNSMTHWLGVSPPNRDGPPAREVPRVDMRSAAESPRGMPRRDADSWISCQAGACRPATQRCLLQAAGTGVLADSCPGPKGEQLSQLLPCEAVLLLATGQAAATEGLKFKCSSRRIAAHPCAATYSTFLAALGTTLQGWGGVE